MPVYYSVYRPFTAYFSRISNTDLYEHINKTSDWTLITSLLPLQHTVNIIQSKKRGAGTKKYILQQLIKKNPAFTIYKIYKIKIFTDWFFLKCQNKLNKQTEGFTLFRCGGPRHLYTFQQCSETLSSLSSINISQFVLLPRLCCKY